MNKIEFIPLIELPTIKDKESDFAPSGTSINNTKEWDIYQRKELNKNYVNIPNPILPGIYQYNLFEIEMEDFKRVIKLHFSDIGASESCSLFGGYAVSINGKIELFPQCCGLLEEIQYWKNILIENFDDFYLMQCHPSPLITKKNNEIIIVCNDEYEPFYPPNTNNEIHLDYLETKNALNELIFKLNEFSKRINIYSSEFGVEYLANILIWGLNEFE